jgi:hypothetical protein
MKLFAAMPTEPRRRSNSLVIHWQDVGRLGSHQSRNLLQIDESRKHMDRSPSETTSCYVAVAIVAALALGFDLRGDTNRSRSWEASRSCPSTQCRSSPSTALTQRLLQHCAGEATPRESSTCLRQLYALAVAGVLHHDYCKCPRGLENMTRLPVVPR